LRCRSRRKGKRQQLHRADGRTEPALLLEFLRAGNTLMATRIDRLARSVKDLQESIRPARTALMV
jgi:DNA invertase Pin-like site-specific DNA recombinase